MKVLLFGGAGNMGSAAAWDLARNDAVDAVGLLDRRLDALKQTANRINSKKITLHPIDLIEREEILRLISGYDVGIISLPDRRSSYSTVELVIEAGLSAVDILGEYHRRPDALDFASLTISEKLEADEYGEQLHQRAIENGVTLVDGMGFAPGISNILVAEGMRKMDEAESVVVRVGGIPIKEAAKNHPLNYIITWAFGNVLREYMSKVKVIKNREVAEVDAGSDYERFRFSKFGKDEELECAITPGMPSFIHTRPELQEFSEKTIRWPGHWQGIETLRACGLFDSDPVKYDDREIVPRDFFSKLIEPRLQPTEGETDVCVMWNTVTGTKEGKKVKTDYYMWDEADRKEGISSMARVTGFPASIAAVLIGKGEIKQKGIVPPEDCFEGYVYQRFMDELWKRRITILEEHSTIE